MDLELRTATIDDAEVIAGVHVASWQAAYRGIVPDDILDNLSIAQRTQAWHVVFRDHDAPLVALRGGRIIGFVGWGASRDADVAELGELYAIYVAPESVNTGAGLALMTAATSDLRRQFAAAVLWVLRDNQRARRFYERFGWSPDGREQVLDDLAGVIEVRYRIDF